MLVLGLGFLVPYWELDYSLLFLKVRLCWIFFYSWEIRLKRLSGYLLLFKLTNQFLMWIFPLSAFIFYLLLQFLIPFFKATVCNQLSFVLGFQVLCILSLLPKDIIWNFFGRAFHISELIDHSSNLSTVLLENRVESPGDILSTLVACQFYILDHGILLDCMQDVGATLTANVIPLEVDLLESLVGTDKVCNDLSSRCLDLIVPNVKFLQTCIMMKRRTKSLEACITQANIVPFETQLLNWIILLKELSEITDTALTNVISFQVQLCNVVVGVLSEEFDQKFAPLISQKTIW